MQTTSKQPLVITDDFIIDFFEKNDELDAVKFFKKAIRNRGNQSNSQLTSADHEAVVIPRKELRKMYSELINLVKLRDDIIDSMKELKQSKLPTFFSVCESNLNIKKEFHICFTCGYKATSKKGLAIHMRKDCSPQSPPELHENVNESDEGDDHDNEDDEA
jgi:hypothetical protein